MPTVVNGIGTWYYGKRRIHRRKGLCSFCKRVGELESYDTTLYFVVVFVPLVPLSHKRVLEVCPTCKRHRVTSLKQWEAQKAQDIASLLDRLQQDPENRETILQALALAIAYQDEALFDKLAGSLASHRLEDPGIQAQLGTAYAYFARHPEAEAAFRASLAVEDDPAVRRQLALTLLKQGRPQDAAPYLQHILDDKLRDQAGLIYLLIEGYQAQGMHAEALQLMDRRDAAFPDLAGVKDLQKQRKLSLKHQQSGKPVRSAYLSESPRAGYHEGSWTSRIPRIVGPILAAGLLCWYLGAALWIGQAREVFLVNGTDRPYTVAVNGTEHRLPPQAATPVRVAEGDVKIESRDPAVPLEPIEGRIETSFFSRPFASHTFAVNPDRLAVLVKEESVYAEVPRPPQRPAELHTGQAFYEFSGLDYEFAPFPATVQAKKGETVTKTRVALYPGLTPEFRLAVVSHLLPPAEQHAYAERLLRFQPDNVLALQWLLSQLPDQEAIAFLEPRLGPQPLLVEWHRAYQQLMEKTHPETDLRPRYRKLAADTKDNPDALYLLARAGDEDPTEAEALLRRTAAGTPTPYVLHGLAYHALDQGNFDEALRWEEKAYRQAPRNPVLRQGYHMILLAAKRYELLLAELRQEQSPVQKYLALQEQITVHALQGDKAKVQAAITEALRLAENLQDPHARQMLQAQADVTFACAQGDVAGFLKAAPLVQATGPFAPALLEGKLKKAAEALEPEREKAIPQNGLLYLAALRAGDKGLAEAQWQQLLAGLAKSRASWRRMGEILAGRRPLDADLVCRLSILPDQKRILLAVAARRYPAQSAQFLALAERLNFTPDALGLCLRQALKPPAGGKAQRPPGERSAVAKEAGSGAEGNAGLYDSRPLIVTSHDARIELGYSLLDTVDRVETRSPDEVFQLPRLHGVRHDARSIWTLGDPFAGVLG
jgi:tetratricopeptide (TPR) repeat protein